MKRIGLMLLIVFVVMAFVPLSSAFAYTGGLLDGIGLNVGSNHNNIAGNVGNMTDGNNATSGSVHANGGTHDTVWYEFDGIADIDGYQALTSATGIKVSFYDEAGIMIGSPFNLVGNGILQSMVRNNVKKVVFYNDSASALDIFEIDVFGEETITPPPPAPTGLTATAGDTEVNLTWTGSAGADSYIVYRDGVNVGTTTTTSFNDSGLTNGVEYTYTVSALNGVGESAQSTADTATPTEPPDTTAPAAPTGLTATAGDTTAAISWTASTEPDLDGYNLYRDAVKINGALLTGTTYNDTGLTNGTQYSYTLTAVDDSGNESNISTAETATPIAAPDTTAPAAPTGLTATAGDTTAAISWTASTEPDLDGYNLYRDAVKINGALLTGTTYNDTGLTNGTQYSYTLTAVDDSGNESNISTAATATPIAAPDTTAPAEPTGLTATPGTGLNGGNIDLSWTASTEPDLAGYNVYVDGVKDNATTITGESYTVIGLTANQAYDFHITALDTSGNESLISTIVNSTANEPPNSIGFSNIVLPFGVGDMLGTAVNFLVMYGEWILLALGVIFAPVLYGLAMRLVEQIRRKEQMKGALYRRSARSGEEWEKIKKAELKDQKDPVLSGRRERASERLSKADRKFKDLDPAGYERSRKFMNDTESSWKSDRATRKDRSGRPGRA